MIPILKMMQNAPIGTILNQFIDDCGFRADDVTSLKYYAETVRDREAEAQINAADTDARCFKSSPHSMYILSFANGAQHCKYVNAQMLEDARSSQPGD